ncbi:uncharacterized protein [Nicotiana tomentosiformis]|uniref:uncharacterized protein n=1 Tax=Nicotiana tomentosiformis TaxID=4098 RepID=UPI00388C5429
MGHVVSSKGIKVDLKKNELVQIWPMPSIATKIQKPRWVLACVVFRSSLFERIKARQYDDPNLLVLKDMMQYGDSKEVTVGDDGALRPQGRIFVPNVDGLREPNLEEAYSSRYFIHPGTANILHDLKHHYWWRRVKKTIVEYVARCLNYQQVKYEHQRLGGLI